MNKHKHTEQLFDDTPHTNSTNKHRRTRVLPRIPKHVKMQRFKRPPTIPLSSTQSVLSRLSRPSPVAWGHGDRVPLSWTNTADVTGSYRGLWRHWGALRLGGHAQGADRGWFANKGSWHNSVNDTKERGWRKFHRSKRAYRIYGCFSFFSV